MAWEHCQSCVYVNGRAEEDAPIVIEHAECERCAKRVSKRIQFVQAHAGWRIKLERYLSEPETPGLGALTSESFVRGYARDIDKTIELVIGCSRFFDDAT